MKLLKSHILLLAVLLLQGAVHAETWWDAEWPLRKKITLDTSASGTPIGEVVGTTALLIRLHDGNFNFTGVKEDGSDLRFVSADDKTELPYHIEKWDTLLNEALIWVKAPDIKPKDKAYVWLYYGNAGSKAVSVNDPKGTYGSDAVLVYHFTEKGTPAADSTGSGISSQNAGVIAEGSIIGSGLKLDGKSVVSIPAAPQLAWSAGSPMGLSLWFKPTALGANAVMLSRKDGPASFILGCDNGVPYLDVNGQRSTGGAAIAPGSWHHLAVSAESGKITLYLDGATYGALAAGLPALNSVMEIGATGAAAFNGEIDELNIFKTTLPAGAVQFAATSQGGEIAAKLVVFGDDEQPTGWMSWLSTGYFGVIFKNLTHDGWAVIIILAVMSLISWFVMIGKARYLGKVGKSNTRFLREWSHVASDLTVLDDGDDEAAHTLGGRMDRKGLRTVRLSPIYRIYRIGVEEIRHRVGGNGSSKTLSATSLQAIRASLDGGLVRETQRLNSSMVLLTIAISGGPFLGLLGTVVGVMITFAAIAAAGDVNVNSIAPGIAAALLATVAGLAVAIPALFGYNYLLTRVKNAVSDMHVFIDEFITKLAEFYSQRVQLPGGAKNRRPAKEEAAKEEGHPPITRAAIQTRMAETAPGVEVRRDEISAVEVRHADIAAPPSPSPAPAIPPPGISVMAPGMKLETQRPVLRRPHEPSTNHQPQEAAS